MSTAGRTEGRGVTILVLGILSLICCGIIFGPIAWAMGAGDLRRIEQGLISPEAKTLTQIGMILGIVGTVLGIIAILWSIFGGGLAMLGV